MAARLPLHGWRGGGADAGTPFERRRDAHGLGGGAEADLLALLAIGVIGVAVPQDVLHPWVRHARRTHPPHSAEAWRFTTSDAHGNEQASWFNASQLSWLVDAKGRLSVICPYRRPAAGAITHSIFRTSVPQKKMARRACHLSVCPSVHLSGHVAPAICPSVCLSIRLSVCPSVRARRTRYLSVCLPAHSSARPSIRPAILSVLSVCPSLGQFIRFACVLVCVRACVLGRHSCMRLCI